MGCLNIVKIPCFDPFKGHRKLQWIYQKLSNPIVKWGSVFTCAYIFTHTLIFIWMVEYKILILICENKKILTEPESHNHFDSISESWDPICYYDWNQRHLPTFPTVRKYCFSWRISHVSYYKEGRHQPYWSRRGLN